jgi:hypothetical protein
MKGCECKCPVFTAVECQLVAEEAKFSNVLGDYIVKW